MTPSPNWGMTACSTLEELLVKKQKLVQKNSVSDILLFCLEREQPFSCCVCFYLFFFLSRGEFASVSVTPAVFISLPFCLLRQNRPAASVMREMQKKSRRQVRVCVVGGGVCKKKKNLCYK